MHRQTPRCSAAGRIWSLFKSLNYSWLKIHGEPFIWKLGAVQAALWCLIGLKVANPLNKSGRRVVAACVLRMRMWMFTTHLLIISLFFTVLLLGTVQWRLNLKKLTAHRTILYDADKYGILATLWYLRKCSISSETYFCSGFAWPECEVPGGISDSGFPFGATFTLKDGGGAPLLEVHYSLAHSEYVRSPIFIPSSLFIPIAHAFTSTHAHTNTRRRTAQWQGPPAAPKHGIPHLFVYASFSFPELY